MAAPMARRAAADSSNAKAQNILTSLCQNEAVRRILFCVEPNIPNLHFAAQISKRLFNFDGHLALRLERCRRIINRGLPDDGVELQVGWKRRVRNQSGERISDGARLRHQAVGPTERGPAFELI